MPETSAFLYQSRPEVSRPAAIVQSVAETFGARDPVRVRAMFGGIARRYDLLNHLLSFNLDRGWRRRAVKALPADPAARVLDLCGGTGDLTVALRREGRAGLAICCDFSHPMLLKALPKLAPVSDGRSCVALEADGLRLPFADGTFDAVTVGFGVRNFADLEAGLVEILRVLRPGGRLIVLEFSQPTTPILASLYRFYLARLLPRIGDGASGKTGPYGYLARTIAEFPAADALAGHLRSAGFAAAGWISLTGGIVCIHTAFKGGER